MLFRSGWQTPLDQFGLDEVAEALHSAGQLIDPAPEAPLCQYLAGASLDLVRSTHLAWIESHLADGQEPSPSPAQVYAWYWNETLGGAALDGAKVLNDGECDNYPDLSPIPGRRPAPLIFLE